MSELEFVNEMKVELIDYLGSDLEIARAAWVSTLGERAEEGDPTRVKGLINMLMRDRHGSPFEQGLLRFRISAPIVVFREHHRHRIASYNEVSGRYVEMKPRFYVPDTKVRPLVQIGKPGAYTFEEGNPIQRIGVQATFEKNSYETWTNYKTMLSNNIAKEVARMVLPLNLMSTMIVAMNPRALMNFLSLRTHDDKANYQSFPMWEIEQVARNYELEFENLFPITYEAFNAYGRVAP